MSNRIWTLSNGLSAFRLLLAFPIGILLQRNDGGERSLLLALIGIAALTDFLDGQAARRLDQISPLGKILDPVADKVVIATIAIILALHEAIPLWFLLITVGRDLLILAGGLYLRTSKGVIVQSTPLGKWTVTVNAAFLIVAVTGGGPRWIFDVLLYASATLLLLSFAAYARRFSHMTRPGTPLLLTLPG